MKSSILNVVFLLLVMASFAMTQVGTISAQPLIPEGICLDEDPNEPPVAEGCFFLSQIVYLHEDPNEGGDVAE